MFPTDSTMITTIKIDNIVTIVITSSIQNIYMITEWNTQCKHFKDVDLINYMKTGFYFKLHSPLESTGNTTWLSEFLSSSTLCFKLQLVCIVLETETFCSVPRCLTKFTYKNAKILIFLHLRTALTTS